MKLKKHYNYQFSMPCYHTLYEIAQKLNVPVQQIRKTDMRKEIVRLNTGIKL